MHFLNFFKHHFTFRRLPAPPAIPKKSVDRQLDARFVTTRFPSFELKFSDASQWQGFSPLLWAWHFHCEVDPVSFLLLLLAISPHFVRLLRESSTAAFRSIGHSNWRCGFAPDCLAKRWFDLESENWQELQSHGRIALGESIAELSVSRQWSRCCACHQSWLGCRMEGRRGPLFDAWRRLDSQGKLQDTWRTAGFGWFGIGAIWDCWARTLSSATAWKQFEKARSWEFRETFFFSFFPSQRSILLRVLKSEEMTQKSPSVCSGLAPRLWQESVPIACGSKNG